MRLSRLALFMLLGMISQVSWGANGCAKDAGAYECIPADPPKVTSPWKYESSTNQTPYEGRATLDEAVQDFFKYNKEVNNWGLENVGSYTIVSEEEILFLPYTGEPIRIKRRLKGPHKHYHGVTGKYLGTTDWGWDFYARRDVKSWTCLEGYSKLYKNPRPSSPQEAPFMCRTAKPKNKNSCDAKVGNPCSVTTGNKTLIETDWVSVNSPLKVGRYYNSLDSDEQKPWTNNYQASLSIGKIKDTKFNLEAQSLDKNSTVIILTRPNGQKIVAQRDFIDRTITGNSDWFIDRDMSLTLTQIDTNTWQVKNVKTGTVETYQALPSNNSNEDAVQFKITRIDYLNGQYVILAYSGEQLATVTDHFGNTLTYQYSSYGDINQIILPDGDSIDYGYDDLNRLVSVTRPGLGTKTYIYDESDKAPNENPNLLTGIIDENGNRYATYKYDDQNRGISTEHADGSQRFELSYGNNSTTVIDEYGSTRRYDLTLVSGTNRVRSKTVGNQRTNRQYDQGGNIISETKNGITTKYTFDESRNLQTSKITAFGKPVSTIILTEWAQDLPVKTKVTEGSANPDGTLKQAMRITEYTHDNHGNALTKTITDPLTGQSRTWTYTYNEYSQKTSGTNPQGLTQTWAYDSSNGNLLSVTDTQGRTTTYSNHTSEGKPQTITDSARQITTLTYDAAGHILTQTQTITPPELTNLAKEKDGYIEWKNWWRKQFNMELLPNPVSYDITKEGNQTATTTYTYDKAGQLLTITLPDGETINYEYDDAHRMVGMIDSLGNRISYTLNGAGDIVKTERYDPQGNLAQSSQQAFDNLGRLSQDVGNNGQQTSFSYDNKDNLTQTQDALSRIDQQNYDALNRATQSTDALGGTVGYTYNALGQLTAVTDSRGNTTSYTINAFGETTQIDSPDTGINTFDFSDDGQLMRQTDASGRVQAYQYDEQGKLTAINDAQEQTIASYSYDDLGRVVSLTNPDSVTTRLYDSAGRVVEKTQQIDGQTHTTRYHYTSGSKLNEMLTPSGRLIVYDYNQGVLNAVSVKHNDSTTQLIDSLSYSPNGIASYNWSQTGQAVGYEYDLDGRLTNITDPALKRSYQYDVGNRITTLSDTQAGINYNYSHDKLDRLLNQDLGNTSLGYGYDKNSNRTQSKVTKDNTVDAVNISYEPNSNRIVGTSYDTSGRITDDGSRTYSYNNAGRIERIQSGAVGVYNAYNPMGQRLQKNSGNTKTYFSYDEQGKLIGEYDTQGNAIREYVYLGNQPIAMMTAEKEGEVLQIHSDHLGTPRAVTNANNEKLWQWEGDAFGDVSPQISQVTMPLRMAGQYHDSETGLFYNYFRFYDPKTGRYVTSDPIGLQGGMNTYGYVGGSPLGFVDPKGLNPGVGCAVGSPFGGPVGCGVGAAIGLAVNTIGIYIISQSFDDVNVDTKADENTCDKDDDPCGPLTRTQAYKLAQSLAGVPRKNRNYFEFDMINRTSRGANCSSILKHGGKYAGYSCSWNPKHMITDHPDGHPHLPGELHHECPHLHVYSYNGSLITIIKYKRNSF